MTDSAKPYQTFADQAGYIVPTKEVLAKTATGNDAQKLTFDTLSKIESGSIKGFDNPADDTTGDFREVLQSTIASSFTQRVNGQHAFDTDYIYTAVKHGTTFLK